MKEQTLSAASAGSGSKISRPDSGTLKLLQLGRGLDALTFQETEELLTREETKLATMRRKVLDQQKRVERVRQHKDQLGMPLHLICRRF